MIEKTREIENESEGDVVIRERTNVLLDNEKWKAVVYQRQCC